MIDIFKSLIGLYPQVTTFRNNVAYDINGNEVQYDLQAVTTQAQKDSCKEQAKALLAKTDWSVLPDVGLANSSDFISYRNTIRNLVTNPVVDPDFPVEPQPIWS